MSIKVYDKNDSFDVQVELSRKYISENFGKKEILLEKNGNNYILESDEWESIIVRDDAYYPSTEDVLIEYGVIAQYQEV